MTTSTTDTRTPIYDLTAHFARTRAARAERERFYRSTMASILVRRPDICRGQLRDDIIAYRLQNA